METIILNNKKYEILNNEKDALEKETVESLITEYFDVYDVIVGDWAYGKLRLKGFNEKNNKYFKKINDVSNIPTYIEKNCAYGCKWFSIKKVVEKN